MHRFFVDASAIAGGRAVVSGGDAAHLARSLRARPGERVIVVADGAEHCVQLDQVAAAECAGSVVWSRAAAAEPRLRVVVLQALPQQSMEEAVDAMTQAGVSAIVPVVTARTVVRPDGARAGPRVERWRAVAREAAALAGRGAVPVIAAVTDLPAALSGLPRPIRLLVADPDAALPVAALGGLDAAVPVAIVVGPEGGLTAEEVETVVAAGGAAVSLGPRILRARLAGAVATAVLLAPTELDGS